MKIPICGAEEYAIYDTKEAVIADGVHGDLAPPEIVQMTGSIHEHKGKQELFYVSDSICKPEQESLVAKGASVLK